MAAARLQLVHRWFKLIWQESIMHLYYETSAKFYLGMVNNAKATLK